MRSFSSSARIGAMVSLVGVALIILGFFLPSTGNPHNVFLYEFIPVLSASYYQTLGLRFLAALLDALPLLGMLIVLGRSLGELSGDHSPRLVWLKRVAAGGGLAIQIYLELPFFLNFVYFNLDNLDFAWGFVVVPLGFLVMAIGTFVVEAHQSHERDTHS